MHLKDPHAHWEMIEGHMIYASRKVPEKIEVQTRYAAEL
jgi:hypothetical protein